MLNKITRLNLLMLAGLASVSVFPALLIAPEITIGQTRVQEASLTGIFQWLVSRKKQRPISRDPKQGLCLITPNKEIYSTQPLFLWKGNLKKIAVSKAGSNKNFWHKDIIEEKTLAIYTGEKALQPGTVYEWKGFPGDNPTIVSEFQVMNEQQRQVITAELKALEKELQTKGADIKTITLKKVHYFAEKELWSDVMQQVYSVPNPSGELLQVIKNLPEKLCEIETADK